MLGTIAFFYINRVFLPIKFKQFLAEKIQETINRDVTIGHLHFEPIKGFIFQNITVYQKNASHKILLHIDEASFNILLAPIFKNKKIIIPTLILSTPFANLIQTENNLWNFSDLIKQTNHSNNLKNWQLILGKLVLENGSLDYINQTSTPLFRESIKNINFSATIGAREKSVKFNLEILLPNRQAAFISKGEYNLSTKKLLTQNSLSNIPLADYLKIFLPKNPISLDKGALSASNLQITYKKPLFEAVGDFALSNALVLIGSEQKILGNMQSPNIRLIWDKKHLSGMGQINISEMRLVLAPEKILEGNISADIDTFAASTKNITAQGRISITKANLTLQNKTFNGKNINITTNFSHKANTFHWTGEFGIKQAAFNLDKNNTFQGDIIAKNVSLTLSKKILDIKTTLDTKNTVILFNKNKKFLGNPGLKFAYQQSPKKPINYTGTLSLKNATISGLPFIKTISNLKGNITFRPDNITTDQLALTLQKTPFKLSGTLSNFKKPELNLKAKAQKIDLSQALKMVPQPFLEKIPVHLTGQADLEASYIGPALKPQKADIKINTKLISATLSGEKLPEKITNISGDIHYENDLISWTNLNGKYHNKTYSLNGKVDNFSRPKLTSDLTSEKINLTTKINLLRKAFRIVTLEGKAFHSSFNITGDVHFFDDESPDLNFKGDLTFNLNDIIPLLPLSLKEKIMKIPLEGIFSGNALFRGKPHQWRDWQLTFDLSSPKITINKYPFEKVNLLFIQRDHNISKFDITTQFYGGNLSLISSANLLQKNIPGKLSLLLENLDLSLWRKDKKIKNRNLAGDLSVILKIAGPGKSFKDLKGNGSFTITNGYLGRIIKLYPNAFFTDARADFIIQKLKAVTDNAELFSQILDLNVAGWVDLNKNLYFDIVPQVGKISFSKKENLTFDPGFLLRGAVSITCSGTIEKPHCSPNASPTKVFKNTTDFILEGVGDIFGELF